MQRCRFRALPRSRCKNGLCSTPAHEPFIQATCESWPTCMFQNRGHLQSDLYYKMNQNIGLRILWTILMYNKGYNRTMPILVGGPSQHGIDANCGLQGTAQTGKTEVLKLFGRSSLHQKSALRRTEGKRTDAEKVAGFTAKLEPACSKNEAGLTSLRFRHRQTSTQCIANTCV